MEARKRTISIQLTEADHKAAKIVAVHSGKTLKEISLVAVGPKAIQLSLADQRILADALSDGNVRDPDNFLKNLAVQYKATVVSERFPGISCENLKRE